MDYVHLPNLAPTQEILQGFKTHLGRWSDYEGSFQDLMQSRRIEDTVSREMLDGGCLPCSEEKPDHCHRSLVAEYLKAKWGNLDIENLP